MGETIVVPAEVKKAVDGLHNHTRWLIVEELMNNKSMTYTELRNHLRIENKGEINYHLTKLLKTALIERFEDWNGNNVKSYYEISSFGKSIIYGLLNSVKPTGIRECKSLQNRVEWSRSNSLLHDKITEAVAETVRIRKSFDNYSLIRRHYFTLFQGFKTDYLTSEEPMPLVIMPRAT